MRFVMAGGGTGGHVIPSLAVAEELVRRGHEVLFVGTRRGLEATIVPRAGHPIEWINIGGLQRVGLSQSLRTLLQLPVSIASSLAILHRSRAAAIFSMGGYVAAPVMTAATISGRPIVLMEPNAMPGLVSRRFARRVARALVGFEETAAWFPPGKSEITGLPVRQAFFEITDRAPGEFFHVLLTGGSRGSHRLNEAVRASLPLFRDARLAVRLTIQTGAEEHLQVSRDFNESGLAGEVVPFLHDMPAAYAEADLVISRSGAGAVNELAAAGKASLLVPFPYAADDHQRHNAEALARAGAARLVLDQDFDGRRLFDSVKELAARPNDLRAMGQAARTLARRGAAGRAADLLIVLAGR